MAHRIPDPANTNAPVSPLQEQDLDDVQGAAPAMHSAKHKPREIVVVGSKVKEVVRD